MQAIGRTVCPPADAPGRFSAVTADLDDPATLPPLKAETVFYFVPPPAEGETDTRMRCFLNHLQTGWKPERIVYLSTTGVYGDAAGAWIDEQTPPAPSHPRGRRRLDAERALHEWVTAQHGTRSAVILRVAGIYGPDRLPLAKVRSGHPLLDPDRYPALINLIHSHDLARICLIAAHAPAGIYNVCDGHPVRMYDYFSEIARHLKIAPPPTVSIATAKKTMSPAFIHYLTESRRISNQRLRETLRVSFQFPDYRHGIAHCFRMQPTPADHR